MAFKFEFLMGQTCPVSMTIVPPVGSPHRATSFEFYHLVSIKCCRQFLHDQYSQGLQTIKWKFFHFFNYSNMDNFSQFKMLRFYMLFPHLNYILTMNHQHWPASLTTTTILLFSDFLFTVLQFSCFLSSCFPIVLFSCLLSSHSWGWGWGSSLLWGRASADEGRYLFWQISFYSLSLYLLILQAVKASARID